MVMKLIIYNHTVSLSKTSPKTWIPILFSIFPGGNLFPNPSKFYVLFFNTSVNYVEICGHHEVHFIMVLELSLISQTLSIAFILKIIQKAPN